MMLPTHALAGMVLALPVAVLAPEFAVVAVSAGFLGGVLPDLDLYVGHRKTLHYPAYFSVLSAPVVASAVLVPTAMTVAVAVFLIAAAVHCVADIFGGGLELRPWEATSERAVYDHHRGRWIIPRRWIRYDGSPEDLVLSMLLSVPLLVVLEAGLRWVVLGSLVVAVLYTGVRRFLPDVAELLFDGPLGRHLPDALLSRVPARYRGPERDERAVAGGERPRSAMTDGR